jgi:methyltransferase (TIGR00027 family)
VLGAVPEHVTLNGMDFEKMHLADELGAAGFQNDMRTLFIWEGVTQYITAEAVDNTPEFVSQVSGAGSAIIFSYVRRGLIDGTDRPDWMQSFLSFANQVGSPMIFGLDPAGLEQYLGEHGLRLVSDVGAAECQELYLQPLARQLNVFDGERAAYAEVMGNMSA